MSTIQTARYEQFTRRLLRIVGGSVMPRLQNDLSPVINIEDPASPALMFWRGHRLASGIVIGTATGGDFPTASLFNPLTTGVLIEVIAIRLGLGSTIWTFGFTQDRTGTVQSDLRFSDTRAALTSVPRGELGFDIESARPSPAVWRMQQTTGTSGSNPQPVFVLAPGTGLQCQSETANSAIVVSFQWIERQAETSELESG